MPWPGGAGPLAAAAPAGQLVKRIPATGERMPPIGMGTWITFDVGTDPAARAARVAVLQAFFAAGGGMIDCSPMYGSAATVVGQCLEALGRPASLFAAEKVWIGAVADGPGQIAASRRLWGVPRFDLVQVHNLLSWDGHLETLRAMKADGRLRYIGITTSHGRRLSAVERIVATEPLDFIQVTYNAVDRWAEQRLLPLARERGVAVIANRPFQRGRLPARMRGVALPGWAAGIGCRSWAQLLLKFVISHPALTCAIPATSRVDHMRDNMAAGTGPMPDADLRRRIAAAVS